MKRIIQFYGVCMALVVSQFLFQACTELHSENRSEAMAPEWAIADLLERPKGLGTEAEQRYVKESFQQIKNALVAAPQEWDLYIKLAQVYMLEARVSGEHGHYYPAALQVLDRVLMHAKEESHHFQASFLRASVLLSLHRFEEALIYGERALAYNSHHALTYGTLVDAHVELGNYQQAIEMADKMNAIRPDLRSYSRISYLREIHGDIEGAIQAMEMAIQAGYPGQEDAAWCRLTLGDLFLTYGRLEEARDQYSLALEERPSYPFALAGMAKVCQEEENYAQALVWLDSAITLIPEIGFYEQKADIYQILGDTTQVRQLASEMLEMLQEDEESGHSMNLEYAKVYEDFLQDRGTALEYVLKEYHKRPGNSEVNHHLAALHYSLGDPTQALEYSQVAMQTQSQDPYFLGVHGLVLFRNGYQEEGRKFIEKSIRVHPHGKGELAQEWRVLLENS